MDEELERLSERLRRGREKIEKALSETLSGRTEEVVKRIASLRERIERSHGPKNKSE
jgi:hypothetical protein